MFRQSYAFPAGTPYARNSAISDMACSTGAMPSVGNEVYETESASTARVHAHARCELVQFNQRLGTYRETSGFNLEFSKAS
jgi:hypothetical protein